MLGASTQLQPPIFIHPQQTRRRSADCGQSDNLTTAPREMFIPIIQSRMKQACQFFGLRIQPGKICSFVQIAVMAGKRKIVRRVFAAMLAWNDMLDVKQQRLLFLPQPAILTTILRALPNPLAQLGVHQAIFAWARIRRALA